MLADLRCQDNQISTKRKNEVLINHELETLYSNFQKKGNTEAAGDTMATAKHDHRKERKLRAEEAKVRALNHNGRVDFSIQE